MAQNEFEDFVKDRDAGLPMKEISYDLAHNIIYAALEYAEDYGFMPHKDFKQITRYFLEEDTDDIPLMEIDCGGKDGNPLYINSGHDNPVRVSQILNQLEKTAGKGNYTYLLSADDYGDYDE